MMIYRLSQAQPTESCIAPGHIMAIGLGEWGLKKDAGAGMLKGI
jgi:hypothetical protein